MTVAEFVRPPGLPRDALRRRIRALHGAHWQAAGPRTVRFYDTFDWRLHQAGWCLAVQTEGDGDADIRLCTLDGSDALAASVPLPFTGPTDLPHGALRTTLADAVGIRALIAQAELEGDVQSLVIRNEDAKIVARLYLEPWRVRGPAGLRRLPDRLRVVALRGFEAEIDAIAHGLTERAGVHPATDSLLDAALARLDRRPCDYSSRFDLALDGEGDALGALRAILGYLLDAVLANEAGVRRDLDSEFLHDFRVAIRRARALLTQVKGVCPAAAGERLLAELVWLFGVTAAQRDLDVHLLEFDDHRRGLAADLDAAVEPLRSLLHERRRAARNELLAALDSARYRALIELWRRVADGTAGQPLGPRAHEPVRALASARIWKAYRRVLREGAAITDDSPPAALHTLRKSAKKLRYLLEFFRSLYPADAMQRAIGRLKRLQDNLGTLQDQSVQIRSLEQFAEALAATTPVPTTTLMAIGALIQERHRAGETARAEFARRFARFARTKVRHAFAALFRPARTSGEP